VELLAPGNLTLPLLVGVALLLGFGLEGLLLARGAAWYYAAGLPLGRSPVPFSRPGRGADEGAHGGLRYRRIAPAMVAFWADRGDRRLPTMLHGLAIERLQGDRVSLDVRWAPPITPVIAAGWLILLGLARGEGQITVPIGALMIGALVVLYHRGAIQACRSLRFALQQEGADAEEG